MRDVCRSAAYPAAGADQPKAHISRRVLRLCRRADGARAVPEAASAVLVGRRSARRRPWRAKPFKTPRPPFWSGAGTPDGGESAGRNGFNLVANTLTPQVRAITDAY